MLACANCAIRSLRTASAPTRPSRRTTVHKQLYRTVENLLDSIDNSAGDEQMLRGHPAPAGREPGHAEPSAWSAAASTGSGDATTC